MYKFLLLLHRNRYRSIDIVFLSFDDMKIVSMNLVAMKFTNISPYYLFFFYYIIPANHLHVTGCDLRYRIP